MYEQPARPRGVVLTRLCFTEDATDAALRKMQRMYPDDGFTSAQPGFAPYAAHDSDAGLFVVCNEGVGWEVTEEKPFNLEMYGHTQDGFTIAPLVSVPFTPDEVRDLATGEPIDLADLVRTFGSRLEVNFNLWHGKLAGHENRLPS